MFQHIGFVCIEVQLLENTAVSLDKLAGGKTDRNAGTSCVIFDQMACGMNTAMDRTALILRTAEILTERLFLVPGNVDRMADQLIHALIFGGGDRDHGHAEHGFHFIDLEGTAVAGDFVHHIQGNYHRRLHLQQLHGKIEVTFDVGGVDDVDDGFGLLVQNKIPGNQLFTGIGRHGIDSGEIGNQSIGLTPDYPVLTIYRNTGKIPDVLIGTGQLVEQGRLAAVLVSDQSKCKQRIIWKRITGPLGMKTAFFSETGVLGFPGAAFHALR